MVFSSITFLFYFLPITLLLYFFAEKIGKIGLKNAVVLVTSLIFYSWGGIRYLFLLMTLVLINYICGLGIARTRYRKVFFVVGLAIDILDLIFFKYLNFIWENMENILSQITNKEIQFHMPEIALPIGISFFTFQIMSYLIDVYRGDTPVQKNIANLTLYIMMFPQLIAGPIVRYSTVNFEIEERKTTIDMVEKGIKRFIVGFAKKVFIANTVGIIADKVFALSGDFSCGHAWLGAICYTLQIFYDFSAYSDMAIGLGLIFGFHFNENFNYPYISKSIREFWRRWHISLSTWFRDYVYVSMGGNRKGKLRTYMNLFLVFLLTGIWHGAAWQFVVWGLYHGAFMLLERIGLDKILKKLPAALQHIYVMIVVIVGWVFFRADSLTVAVNYIRNMFSLHISGFSLLTIQQNTNSLFWFIFMISVLFSMPVCSWIRDMLMYKYKLVSNKWMVVWKCINRVCYLALFEITIIYLSGLSYNPFIYFKF